jgi:hypothetical protein
MTQFSQVSALVNELVKELREAQQEWRDRLPGGEADQRKPSDFDPHQLAAGIGVEVEHTNDVMVAMEIAMDHLAEDPRYYTKLRTIHKD